MASISRPRPYAAKNSPRIGRPRERLDPRACVLVPLRGADVSVRLGAGGSTSIMCSSTRNSTVRLWTMLRGTGRPTPNPGWNRSSRLVLEVRMKFLIAIVVTMFFTSGAVHADDRAACRLGCNGSGACLRACDLTTCRQACGGNGTCLQACQPSDCRLGCNGSGACLRDCAERDRGLVNR